MDLAERYQDIQKRMAAACERSGRDPKSVTLLAVSKGHPASAITELVQLGQTWFGESKVQEAKAKIPQCPGNARWHLIGHLQTNKAKEAVHWFELIESVDSFKLAEELQKCAEKAAKTVRVLLEVNVAGEASKYGFSPDAVVQEIEKINALKRIEIHGLMTIAPWSPQPERSRAVFRKLVEVRSRCEQILGAPLSVLSMGMSNDFEVAIEEGSTLIRVGTLLFGERVRSTPMVSGEGADLG